MSTRRASRFALPAIVAMAATVHAGPPREVEVKPDETWVHPGAKIEFPPSLNMGIRYQIHMFEPDDYSADYAVGPEIKATLYVYPVRTDNDAAEADTVTDAIKQAWDTAKVERSEEWKFQQGNRDWNGRKVTYTLTRKDEPDAKLRSFLWLLRFGKWQLKLRVTCPAATETVASTTGEKMLAALRIP